MNEKVKAEFLEKYDYWYNNDKINIEKNIKKALVLLDEFSTKYTLDYIRNMSMDDYVIGIPKKEGFCRWIEQKLSDLGDIRGGQLTANQRFGIYYDNKIKDYVFKRKKDKKSKFGIEKNEVFSNIKKELLFLIEGTIKEDENVVEKTNLNPLFKHKINYLYNKDNEIPIYGENDINKLLLAFDIPFDINSSRYHKRRLLFNFYKELKRSDISLIHFMHFVYNNLGYRSILRKENNIEIAKKEIDNYKLVDVVNVKKTERKKINNSEILVKSETYDTYMQKQMTGKKGQNIVKKYLQTHKKELDIDGDIDCPCEYNDSVHYDFSYNTKKGEKIFVEVKASKNDNKDKAIFDMSAAERNFMIDNIDNYYIFYINNVYHNKVIKRIPAKLVVLEIAKYYANFELI